MSESVPTWISVPGLITPVVLLYHWYDKVPAPKALTDIGLNGP